MGELCLGHLAVGRGDVHDPAAAALIAHGPPGRAAEQHRAAHVDVHQGVPAGRGEVKERDRAVHAGVVDQDVNAAEVRRDRGHQAAAVADRADIGLKAQHLPVTAEAAGRGVHLTGVPGADGHGVTVGEQSLGARVADALAAPGDQSDLVHGSSFAPAASRALAGHWPRR